jgi:hypothetical protein
MTADDKTKLDNANLNVNLTVATAAATAAKVSTESVTFQANTLYLVLFTLGNSVSSPTLNGIPIRLGTTNASTTTFGIGANTVVPMYYNATNNVMQITGSYRTSDSTEDYNLRWENSVQAGEEITRNKIIMEGIDGKFYPLTIGNTTAATKTVSTQEFRLDGTILVYNTTATIAADAIFSNVYVSEYFTSTNYTFNQSSGFVAYRSTFLVGTINASGNFVLDNTTLTSWLTQTLPTTDDGKVYIYLGITNNTTTAFRLEVTHPIYQYKDGAIRAYSGFAESAATLTTARTLTIGSTGKTFNGSANVSWSLAEIGAYAATNPAGYTSNTGTVTSVSGAGGYGGLTLSGTVTTSGSITLGGTPTGTWPISVSGNANTATTATTTTGNAGSATVLQTARNINGTSFNGSADITTANWGTARTVTIGATGKSVNGSANVSWTLAEIGAQAALTNPVTGTGTTNYVPKFTGAGTIGDSQIFDDGTNVGIGTTSPSTKFDVDGNIRSYSRTSTYSIYLNSVTGSGPVIEFGNADSDAYGTIGHQSLQFQFNSFGRDYNFLSSGSSVMYIGLSSGNVGIGTTAPGAKLDLWTSSSAGGGNTLRFTNATTGIDNEGIIGKIEFYSGDASVPGPSVKAFIASVSQGTSPDGTLVFATDTNTGTPTERMRITSDGQTYFAEDIYLRDGSTTSGDVLVRIYDSSDDGVIDVYQNNSVVNRIHGNGTSFFNAGNVGIGTTSPAERLHVIGKILANNGGSLYIDSNATNTILAGVGARDLVVELNSANRMIISSAGSLRLNNYGSGSKTGTATQRLAVDASGNVIEIPIGSGPVDGNGTANYVTKWSDADTITNSIIYDNGTNVGIDNTSPTVKLAVGGAIQSSGGGTWASSAGYVQMTHNNAGTGYLSLYYDSETLVMGAGISQKNSITVSGHTADNTIYFRVGDAERMRITSSGNVGIGTTAPNFLLTLDKNSSYTLGLLNSNIGTPGQYTGLTFGYTGTTYQKGAVYFISKDANGVGDLVFALNNVASSANVSTSDERMRITSAGNVGIGTTSPSNKFVAVNDATFNGENSYSIAAAASSDTGYKTVIGYDYANDIGVISAVRQGIQWKNLSILPVGNTNLGVGTITPSERLHVSGNLRVTGAYYDSNNEAGTSGQVLSSTGSGTDWVTPATTTASSLYDLLPAARTTYDWTVQMTSGTWADIFSSNTVLSNGTWMVQVYVDDYASGGQQYQETYSGVMSWGNAASTNQGGVSAISEVVLHRSGHAANAGQFYLRTQERATSTLLLQGMINYSHTSNTTINFKFVKVF